MHSFFFGFVLLPLLVVVGFVFLIARMFSGSLSRGKTEEQIDETRMIQEIYTKMSRMEERVEVLETLLIEGSGKEEGGKDA